MAGKKAMILSVVIAIMMVLSGFLVWRLLSDAEKQSGSSFTSDQTKKRVAVLTLSFYSEYWGYVSQGCKAYAQSDPSIELTVEGPSGSTAYEEQKKLLTEDLKENRYDGYLIASMDNEMVSDILKEASVPVVAIDSGIDADCVICEISTNNEVAAAAGAKKAVSMAGDLGWEKIECASISGVEGDLKNERRMAGFREGIEASGGVWMEEDSYTTDKTIRDGKKAMKKIMEDHPEGIAIVACYNDRLAGAALEASKESEAFSNTVFIGFDGIGSTCDRILNDDDYKNMVTVAQNPYEMGYHAMQILADHFSSENNADETETTENGKDSVPDEVPYVDSGYSVITNTNAQERMVQIQSHLT